jgi:hypothetical protein
MKPKKKIIILQIDGLGYADALEAIHAGHMPFLKKLLSEEEYEILKYRSGIPSSTPYVQAGILYGDNSEIPSFRWWDRQEKKTIQVIDNTFAGVDYKYFKKSKPLLKKGAAIASLFAGGSKSAFAVSYVDRGTSRITNAFSKDIFIQLLMNPLQNIRWHWHTFKKTLRISLEIVKSIIKKRAVDWAHFPMYLLDQLFLFYPTSIAIKKALGANYPVTYAGFYSYDNVSHIFGKKTSHGNGILKDIDNALKSISKVMKEKKGTELIILSDHGETKFNYIANKTGKTFAEIVSAYLPEHEISEIPGKTIKPQTKTKGKIHLAYTGGLAHLYDTSRTRRMSYKQIVKKFPGLIEKIVKNPEIAGAIVKDGNDNLFITQENVYSLNPPLSYNVKQFLTRFDHPEIVAKQLSALNSFKNSGDIIIIAEHENDLQISFETLVCGHGSVGGGQSHPFILLKKSHKLDTKSMTDARELHPFFKSLIS